jgi:hypothetical protein
MITAIVTLESPISASLKVQSDRDLTPPGLFAFDGRPLLTFRNAQIAAFE